MPASPARTVHSGFVRKTALETANALTEFATANPASQGKPAKKTIVSIAARITESARKTTSANAFWASRAKTALKGFVRRNALRMANALIINASVISAGQAQPVKTAFAPITAADRKRVFASTANAYAKRALPAPTVA